MTKWDIQVSINGRVDLPSDLCELLLKMSGIRSRKKRHVKKAIKNEFMRLIKLGLE